MKIADNAGFMRTDYSIIDFDNCDLKRAIKEFEKAPWEKDINKEFFYENQI